MFSTKATQIWQNIWRSYLDFVKKNLGDFVSFFGNSWEMWTLCTWLSGQQTHEMQPVRNNSYFDKKNKTPNG